MRLKRLLRPRFSKNNDRLLPAVLNLACALQSMRQPGGASRDRTDDPLLAKQVLSQLSYGPEALLESPAMDGWAPRGGIRAEWWVWEDSNHRPHPYQGCALTT
jgi:hypothetical protein